MQSLRCRLRWSKLILLDLVSLVALVDAIIVVKTDGEQTDPAGSGFSWWPWCCGLRWPNSRIHI